MGRVEENKFAEYLILLKGAKGRHISCDVVACNVIDIEKSQFNTINLTSKKDAESLRKASKCLKIFFIVQCYSLGPLSEYHGRLPLIFASTASLLYPTSTAEKRGDASLNPCNVGRVELESEESIHWKEGNIRLEKLETALGRIYCVQKDLPPIHF